MMRNSQGQIPTLDGRYVDNPALCPRCETAGVDFDGGCGWRCPTCELAFAECERCGKTYTAPMSPYCKDGHEAPTTYHPFIPYFDFALGKQIDSLAQRHREMRSAHLDYRDKLSSAQLGERREREEHRRHERERGHAPGGPNRTSGRVYSR